VRAAWKGLAGWFGKIIGTTSLVAHLGILDLDLKRETGMVRYMNIYFFSLSLFFSFSLSLGS
tara:strand:+ start:463 stop:648 length:186 start_codon:yes stop_codon:yes gene_type:complete